MLVRYHSPDALQKSKSKGTYLLNDQLRLPIECGVPSFLFVASFVFSLVPFKLFRVGQLIQRRNGMHEDRTAFCLNLWTSKFTCVI